MLWPDAWKVKINIKSLVPNNFNMYMNYYLHGYGASFKKMREYTMLNNRTLANTIQEAFKAVSFSFSEDDDLSKGLEAIETDAQIKRNEALMIQSSELAKIHSSKYILENAEKVRELYKEAGYTDKQIDEMFRKINAQQKGNKTNANANTPPQQSKPEESSPNEN